MKPSNAYLVAVLMALSMAAGCARQPGIPEDESAGGEYQELPFDRNSQSADSSPSHPLSLPSDGKLPAGTPITVRLKGAVSSASSHAGDSFEGALDEPVIIDGQTVAARGAAVKGRVLAAKASSRGHDPGYLRIALVSLTIAGNPLALQTSSIFAKGGAHGRRSLAPLGGGGDGKAALLGTGAAGGAGASYAQRQKEVSFGEEHRLTFRLAQAADLNPKN